MLAVILLISLGVDWASGYAIAGYCMTHGVSPFGYAFWQSFGPCCLLLLVQSWRRELWLEKSGVIYAVLCGLFGIVLPNLLIYYAAKHVPSGLLTVIANLAPIFTYLLALLFKDELFSWLRMSLVMLGLVGISLIIIPNQPLLNWSGSGGWLYLALFIPLSYAFSAVYISRFHPGAGNILSYALWMLMFATLCISPLTVLSQQYYPLNFRNLPSWLIVLEILLSSCGYLLLFALIKRVGAVYYTLVNAVAVITGVGYGHYLFAQQFSCLSYWALAIILITIIGLTYTQFSQRRK